MTEHAIEATVSGQVQGVGFRAWTREEACARGLRGWVRNERDGSVRALIAGEASAVDSMLQALWCGPPAARVEDVRTAPVAMPALADFDIRR